jgi:hypothetical protein
MANDQDAHRRQDNRGMTRLGGPAAGAAAFGLAAGLACDAGGFNAISWDSALVAVSAALLVLFLVGAATVSRSGAVLVGAAALLTAWTAISWLWSESPPRALEESQRVALYCVVAALVVAVRPSLRWTAGGVAAAATFVAVWNLVTRIHGVDQLGNSGAGEAPVGYANSLALLCAIGLLLLPMLPPLALLAAPVLVADLVLQRSTGALAALAAGVLAYAFVSRPRLRGAAVVVALCAVAAVPFAFRGHERGRYWSAALAEVRSAPVLGTGAGTYANWWLRERTVPISTQEAHSLYLETLAELGPLGLALVLVVVAAPLAAAWRLRVPAAAAVAAAYAAGAAVDFHWELAGVTVPALLVGAAVAAGDGRRVRRSAAVPAAAAVTVAAVLAYGGNSRLDGARAALRIGDSTRAVLDARAALRLAPFSPDAWAVIGDATRDPDAYRQALELDPNDWSLWYRLALLERGEPRRLAMRKAARLNPLGPASGR